MWWSDEMRRVWLSVLAALLICALGADAALRAGVARVEITPPVGTPLGGYGARKGRPSTGVHDPLTATALVLSDGRETVALCAADMVLMPSSLFDDVARRVRARTGIPRDHLLLSASHSHASSGAIYKETRFITGSFNSERYREVAEKLAGAIATAAKKMEPARYGSGSARVETLSRNRTRDGGPNDLDLNVLRIDRADGRPLAVLVNFAAHPTVLGASVMEFSADFPGPLREALERAFPGALALFVNGTQGNLSPAPPPAAAGETPPAGGPFAAARRLGEALAAEAARVARGIQTTPEVRIRVAFQPLRIRIFPAVEFTTYLSQVSLNRDVLVGIPGEAFAEFGLAIKEKGRAAGFAQVFKLGLTNGSIGYLLPRPSWLKHEYESLVSAAGIDLGPFVVDNSIALMEKLARSP